MAQEKLQIEISAKDQASGVIRGLAGNVRGATDSVKSDFSAVEIRAKGLAGALKGHVQQVGGFSKAVQLHAGEIRMAGMAMVAVGAMAIHGAKQLVSAAGQMERYAAQYKVLAGSAELAEKRLKSVTKFAATTPFELPELIEADRLIQAFNLDLGGIERTLTVVGDAAAGMGVPLRQVVSGLAKLKEGMFETEQMALIGLTRERLAELGVQFSETGQVMNREDLFPAAIKVLERFGGTMDEVSETVEGATSNLADSWFQLKATAGKALAPTAELAVRSLTAVADVAKLIVDTPLGKAFVLIGAGAGIAVGLLGPLVILLPTLAKSWEILSIALGRNAAAARAAAAANTQAGAAAVAGGAGAAAGGAAAGGGGLLRGLGMGAGARVAGGAALRYALPAWLAYEGAKFGLGRWQGKSEQQVAEIEGAGYTPLQEATMARWRAGQQGIVEREEQAAGFDAAQLAAPGPAAIAPELVPPAAAPIVAPPARTVAGMTEIGPGAWALPGGAAEEVSVQSVRQVGPGRYELVIELRPTVPPGVLDDNTTEYLEDLSYAGEAI